jgi:hypothetical protein
MLELVKSEYLECVSIYSRDMKMDAMCVRPCVVGIVKSYNGVHVSSGLPVNAEILDCNLLANFENTIRRRRVSLGTVEWK